jgi:hypothetical protein
VLIAIEIAIGIGIIGRGSISISISISIPIPTRLCAVKQSTAVAARAFYHLSVSGICKAR